ncbi:hypothetical protein RJ640_023194 [Escallonia rubra]|uniref:ATP-dependent zinc metalloprotease FTSH, chloroplastic n=1 Tax=Escallonia rubra TaxID=112253 RepID=A0AA88RJG1_9ASTE|nr:hypothetical protein RJ640_023194 [Escallonia rubra]
MSSVSSQPQFRYTQPPSKVLHLRNLPWECTEEELVELGKPFGNVVNTKCNVGANRNQAFIEFAELNQAIAMISYYLSSSEPAQVRGKTVYLQYSNRQEIVNNKTSADVPGNVLLVTINGPDARLVSIECLHLVFSAFGLVQKITTFEKTAGFQALVQFPDVDTASSAKDALDGRSIPSYLIPELGLCSLKITYSAHTDLSVKFQSHRSRDYTNPMLPISSSAIDASGQFSTGVDGKQLESESNVLLASIENMLYAVTLDVLHTVFSTFGPVLKIAMFDKNGGLQALIQYPDVQTAVVAKESLEGHCIYDGGFCKLHISYSRHSDLSIKVNNDRSRDFTHSNSPMLNPQPSILGHQPNPMAGANAQMYGRPQFAPAHEVHAAPQPSAGWSSGVPGAPQSMPSQMHNHPYMPPTTESHRLHTVAKLAKADRSTNLSRIKSRRFTGRKAQSGGSGEAIVSGGSGNTEVEDVGDKGEVKRRLPVVVFFMGLFARIRSGFEKVLLSDWFSWWPFWRQEKRLERLIAEADASPLDAAKQSALLAELNKQSPESVIGRFEQRVHAVDSRGVAEYIRALVATNAIAEYLPDEQSGKPATLPALLQELKQRASGNMDEPFLSPGISDKQPLHVVMVDPKMSNRSSRFAQELISTILFTVAIGLVWLMGAAALQKYIGGLGGIGTSGVGSSSSYSPKELNKEIVPEKNVKTFKDVKGCDDAKQELEEVVEYLRNPAKFTRLGGKLPKGILLTGAPGTGKTLLAKAIAGEAGVPFFYRAGSEFEEMFVGVGARRVRSLFQAAKKKAPCIIFIDEIDAVGSTRKQWEGHTKKTLHQLLVEMDGFEQNEGIILMAATNLPDILDPALTRPGRFDRHIVVPNPDVRGRQDILELYLQDKPLSDDVDVKAIARGTPGFNGADLANLVNIAAIKAAVEGAEKLNAMQLEFAKDRIIMGTERKTMFVTEESKKLTAYHESGHAIVAFNTDGAHPIHKATIMPRGSALGMVTQLPSNDETSISKKQLLARLDVCMGGRVAEELIFGQDYVTTGASSDLHTATELAQYMVSTCGMSDTIGPVHIKERPGSEMQSRIDAEVVKLLREAYDRVKALLKKHEKALHALATALLEYETMSAEEIRRVLLPSREGPVSDQEQQQQEEVEELVLA